MTQEIAGQLFPGVATLEEEPVAKLSTAETGLTESLAFIDESGNTDIDVSKPGVSRCFVICAVLQDNAQSAGMLKEELSAVSKKHFGGGVMSSRSVAGNDSKRKRIASLLARLDFHAYALVVDKARISSLGLSFRRSFYKHLHGRVEKRLMETHPCLSIVADRYGTEEFMRGFVNYIQRRFPPTLFREGGFSFRFEASHSIIELADFLAGTIARECTGTHDSPGTLSFLSELKDKIEIEIWPPDWRSDPTALPVSGVSGVDRVIAEQGAASANQFLREHAHSRDLLVIEQVRCVELLLLYHAGIDPTAYVSSSELMDYVTEGQHGNMTQRHLRSRVIAKLRDAGVLIASSTRGYKLPACKDDLKDFMEHSMGIIQPMVDRLAKCSQQIRLATNGKYDMLDTPGYAALQSVIERVPPRLAVK